MARYNNQSIMHAFVYQETKEGSASTVFFEGDKIYSHGYHYCMATRYELGKHDKKVVILINEDSYSHTTAKHLHYLKQAISRDIKTFYVPSPDGSMLDNCKRLFSYIQAKYESMLNTAHKGKKVRLYGEIKQDITTLRDLMATFSIKFWSRKKTDRMLYNADFGELTETLDKLCIEVKDNKKKREAIKLETLKAKQAEAIQRYEDNKHKWLSGEISHINIPSSIRESLVRINKESHVIETSRGAIMSITAAKRLALDLQRHTAIIGKRYGQYVLFGINSDTLQIGCHYIPISEVERMMELLLP